VPRRRSLVTFAFGAALVAASAPADAAPPQVTIYLGGYGQPTAAPAPAAQATQQGTQPASSASGALQTEAAFVQGVAYARYLQYVAAVNYQAAARGAGTGADATQYFTNGAAATTVPSAGPGSGYFTNGAEATRVAPPASASAAPPPPPPLPPPAPLAPFWWVEGSTPPPASSAPSAPPPPPPEAAPTVEARLPEVAMSFQDWLESMGANLEESEPTPTAAPAVEAALLAEPSAAAYEVRPRAPYAVREKLRERIPPREGSAGGLVVVILGTFAIGLAVGALAMRKGPLRTGQGP
jgi:hypothetical protein